MTNPCSSAIFKKVFRRPQSNQWLIVDKEVIDEIIFRNTNSRDRLMLELMARGGMRIGEVIKLRHCDVHERKLVIQSPKSGRQGEVVYIPRKLLNRLSHYVNENNIGLNDQIFPISYVTTWAMVKKAGRIVGIDLRPHDLRRHTATFDSRSGTPIEIVSIMSFYAMPTYQLHSGILARSTTPKRLDGLRHFMDNK